MVVLTFGIYPVLNIHGEVLESLAPADTTLEEAFLPTLKQLHDRFPQLRIVVCMPLICLYRQKLILSFSLSIVLLLLL